MLSRFCSGIWKLAPLLVAVFAFHVNSIQAQERIAPKPNVSKSEEGSPTSGATTVTALKPNFTRKEATPVAKGITEVPLASRLEGIFSGGEPRSVQDLLALQEQQAKVVGKIQAVTVHVEQGAAQGSGVIITPMAMFSPRPTSQESLISTSGYASLGSTKRFEERRWA